MYTTSGTMGCVFMFVYVTLLFLPAFATFSPLQLKRATNSGERTLLDANDKKVM